MKDQGSIIQDSLINCKDEDHATKPIAAELQGLTVTFGPFNYKKYCRTESSPVDFLYK